jgi:hypothetical protein
VRWGKNKCAAYLRKQIMKCSSFIFAEVMGFRLCRNLHRRLVGQHPKFGLAEAQIRLLVTDFGFAFGRAF